MADCTFFDGKTCPETTPTEARCQICILLLIYDKFFNNARLTPKTAKLPQ